MPKIKIEHLTNSQLDHAVHIALGLGYREDFKYGKMYLGLPDKYGSTPWDNIPKYYSSDWALAGPIIERERYANKPHFSEWIFYTHAEVPIFGHTFLVAGMRCFVAMKLGDEVEIPEDIK